MMIERYKAFTQDIQALAAQVLARSGMKIWLMLRVTPFDTPLAGLALVDTLEQHPEMTG